MNVTHLAVQLAGRYGLEFARPACLRYLWLAPVLWGLSLLALRKTGLARLVLAIVFRTAAILLIVLALSGLSVRGQSDRPCTVIAGIDVSDSMGERGREWAREHARSILEGPGAAAEKGVIFFARGSEMRRALARQLADGWFGYSIAPDATDIASAVEAASLAFPPAGPRRLLLFSDGNENSGDARAAAAQASRGRIRIDCFTPPETKRTAGALRKLDLPEEASVSEKFLIRIIAENRGDRPLDASLAIRDGEEMIKQWAVSLQPGTNAFELPYSIVAPGAHRITASLATGEGVVGGESIATPVLIIDRPKVLCLSGTREGRNFLAEALVMRDIDVRVGGAELLPRSMDELLKYDCVVLSNLPRASLSEAQMDMLRRYVRDSGGGLIMLGGAGSFGPGGYRGTAIEEALPVSMEQGVPFEREKKARLCLILVIDKSGSMGFGFGIKIMAARRAAEELVKQLTPNDMVGIIPFDAFYSVLVPLEPVGDRRQSIIDRIRMIEAGGDTLISRPLEQSLAQMQSVEGRVKHVILLTDGQTKDLRHYDYRRLMQAFARGGITVSTVGIGRDADSDFLRAVALGTGGEYYYVKDATTLPLIVLEDTKRVLEKSGFLEEKILPRIAPGSEMLKGIKQEQVPPILGYVITTPKKRAEVAVYTNARGLKDPLLAGWRYGLGRAVAYTSDAEARWSKEMVGWTMFSKFWTQVLRWTMRERSSGLYLVRARSERGSERLELETFSPADEGASFRVGLPAGKAGSKRFVNLHQVAPHTYAGEGVAIPPGLNAVTVEKREGGTVTDQKEAALMRLASLPPAGPEASVVGNNVELLGAIARATGGNLNPAPEELAFPPETVPVRKSLDGWLLPFVFALILADVAVRKLWT